MIKSKWDTNDTCGVWKGIHDTAAWFDISPDIPERDRRGMFSSYMEHVVSRLGCESCKTHAKEYITTNPVVTAGPSTWSWSFHNAVNRRLNKPEMSFQTYMDTYISPKKACTTCGSK